MKKVILLIVFALSITFVNAQDVIIKRYTHLAMTINNENVLDTNVVSVVKLNSPQNGDITVEMFGNRSVLKFMEDLSGEDGLQVKKMKAVSNDNIMLVGFTGNLYIYDVDDEGRDVLIVLDDLEMY
jgi:hypothetical protein